ncbi:MAG: PilZ domain-containing protein [Acidobacteriota bacterium]|nr:PilZ domain-containing protein [Acidobacteriota bacterium]
MTSPTRKFRRTKVDVRVRLHFPERESESAVVRTYEMSEGGLSVYTTEALTVGTALEVEFSLPGVKPFRTPAVVRNVRGFRCGLQLTDPSKEQRAAILHYLASVADVIEI